MPPWEKEIYFQMCVGMGYANSQEGNPGLGNYPYFHVASWVCQGVYFKNYHTLRQVNMDTPKRWCFQLFWRWTWLLQTFRF